MNKIFEAQKAFFRTNETKSYSFRKAQLLRLREQILLHEEDIINALYQDLHKSRYEAYATEIGLVLKSIRIALRQLKRWMKPTKVKTPLFMLNTTSYIAHEPLGAILIIGPYNYPFQLVIEPLIGAIAAGNTAILKPSEQTPHVEDILVQMIQMCFPSDYVHVVTGDHLVTQELLALPFDHIFFTGSTHVGQIVYEAASKHLTPVTLELGGKSPTIVDATAKLKIAARRIAFGKFINAGQTCIAPDYLYVQDTIKDEFLKLLHEAVSSFTSYDEAFGHIVNDKHMKRLLGLLPEQYKPSINESTESLLLRPVILPNATWNDAIMKEEIFGPILPVISYHTIDEVITQISHQEQPLALYLFSRDKQIQKRIWSELSFGGGAINDTVMQFSNMNLPFGGVGHSGIGQYHGKHTFHLFSHHKSTIKRSNLWDPPITYPPHTSWKERLVRWILK